LRGRCGYWRELVYRCVESREVGLGLHAARVLWGRFWVALDRAAGRG